MKECKERQRGKEGEERIRGGMDRESKGVRDKIKKDGGTKRVVGGKNTSC